MATVSLQKEFQLNKNNKNFSKFIKSCKNAKPEEKKTNINFKVKK